MASANGIGPQPIGAASGHLKQLDLNPSHPIRRPEAMPTTTATATPAERLLANYAVPIDRAAAELTDSKAAMLSWAGRDGRYTLGELEAILKGHGETLQAWVDDCDKHDNPYAVHDAAALLAWLGY